MGSIPVTRAIGEMAERLNAPDLKSDTPVKASGVRIPLSPLILILYYFLLSLKKKL